MALGVMGEGLKSKLLWAMVKFAKRALPKSWQFAKSFARSSGQSLWETNLGDSEVLGFWNQGANNAGRGIRSNRGSNHQDLKKWQQRVRSSRLEKGYCASRTLSKTKFPAVWQIWSSWSIERLFQWEFCFLHQHLLPPHHIDLDSLGSGSIG